jgi:hypothetical protein
MAIISSNTAVIKFTNSFAPGPSSRRSWTWPPRSKQRSPGTDKSDVTLRICTRAAIFLSSHTDPAPAIFAGVKARYDLGPASFTVGLSSRSSWRSGSPSCPRCRRLETAHPACATGG